MLSELQTNANAHSSNNNLSNNSTDVTNTNTPSIITNDTNTDIFLDEKEMQTIDLELQGMLHSTRVNNPINTKNDYRLWDEYKRRQGYTK